MITSALLSSVPGVSHAFGDLKDPVAPFLREAWDARHPSWKQVHGIAIGEVRRAGDTCGEVDALWTRASDAPIGVVTADCVPVLLARRDGRAVAAVHAGWRGTKARILESLWQTMRAAGERPADWVAAIGPAIGPCCYEVDEALAEQFSQEFGEAAVPSSRHLDLAAVNEMQLREIGVSEVDVLRFCTRCTLDSSGAPIFHSYRREGGGTRQYSIVMTQR